MPITLVVKDEKPGTGKTAARPLVLASRKITLRDLIRERIYQEAQRYNENETIYFNGLVEPSDVERTLNGYKMRIRRQVDWQEQFERALEAFGRNGFFVLVGDKQVESLDEEIEVNSSIEVTFVKLAPLVGG